ncbi:cytochrome P450 [Xylariales sp. PMI_506]|nr:cytochrome P450 [Xylariales sp. PMI_506]
MSQLQSLSDTIVEKWPAILVALLAGLAVYIPRFLVVLRMATFPTVGTELGSSEKRRKAYLAGARSLYYDGYRKFKERAFKITTSRDSTVLVLPAKFLPELKKLPDSIVSMSAAVDEHMEAKYTRIQTTVPIVPHTIKADLTPGLVRLNPVLSKEVQEVIDLEMPECSEWTSVNIHHKLLRIVGMVSGRIFIGPELGRKEEYLDAAINYTIEAMNVQKAVQTMRPWLRPFLANRLPEAKKLDQRIKAAEDFMTPVVKKRMELVNSDDQPDDMLQWLIKSLGKFPDKVSQNLPRVQLGISFAAIHTTVLTATNVFYSIAAVPDFIPELREEIEQALKENDGIFTSNALQSMKKLDSFLKETLRFYPATMANLSAIASFQRKVLQPFSLSDGQVIPQGITIEVPAVAISFDPEIFPNPEKFDPLRFYKIRQLARDGGSNPENAALNQFVSVSQNSLTFGYGRHACPGRFFAANELKMILSNMLLKYDIRLVDGATERYPNMEFAHMSIPDPRKELLFKSR